MLQIMIALLILLFLGLFMVLSVPMAADDDTVAETAGETVPPARS